MHKSNSRLFKEASIYKVNQQTNSSTNSMARNLKNIFNGFLQRQATDDEYLTNSDSQINSVLSNFGMTEDFLIDKRKLPKLILKYARYDNAILFDSNYGGNPYDVFMFYPTSVSDQIDPITGKTYRENMSSQENFSHLVDMIYPSDETISNEYEDIISRAQEEFWKKLSSDDTLESSEAIEYVWARAIFFGRAVNQLWNNVFGREMKPIWYLLYNIKKYKETSFHDLDATEKENIKKEIELLKQEIENEKIKKEDEYDDMSLDYDDSNEFDTFGADNLSYDNDKNEDTENTNETSNSSLKLNTLTKYIDASDQNAADDFKNLLYFCKSCLGGWKKMERWAKIIGYGVPYSTDLDSSDIKTMEESRNNPYDQITDGNITKVKSFGLVASLSYQLLHRYAGYAGSFFPDYVKSKLIEKASVYLDSMKNNLDIIDTDIVKGYEKTDAQNQDTKFGPDMNLGKEDKHYGFTENVIERLPELLQNVKDYIPPTAKTEQRIKNAKETAYNSFKLLNMIFYNLPQVNYNGEPVQFEDRVTRKGTVQVPISLVTVDQLGNHRKDGVNTKDVLEALNSPNKRNPKANLDPRVDTSIYAITQAFNTFKQVNYDKLEQKDRNSFDWVDSYLDSNYNEDKIIPSKLFSKSNNANKDDSSKKSKLSDDEKSKQKEDLKKQKAINKANLKSKNLEKYLYDPTSIYKIKKDDNGNLVVDDSIPVKITRDFEPKDDDIDNIVDKIDNNDFEDNKDSKDKENKDDISLNELVDSIDSANKDENEDKDN